jgi:hypothetical protein
MRIKHATIWLATGALVEAEDRGPTQSTQTVNVFFDRGTYNTNIPVFDLSMRSFKFSSSQDVNIKEVYVKRVGDKKEVGKGEGQQGFRNGERAITPGEIDELTQLLPKRASLESTLRQVQDSAAVVAGDIAKLFGVCSPRV